MPSEDDSSFKIRTDSSLFWHAFDDEVIVLDASSSIYFRANRTGALIWQKLGEPSSRNQLVDALIDRYGISNQRAEENVDAFLSQLEAAGLLEGSERKPVL